MLIDEPSILRVDPILAMVALVGGRGPSKRLQQGVYEIGHFGSSNFMSGYEDYPELPIGPYGVCDSVEQLFEACPELRSDPARQFVVTVTPIVAADEPADGGWRWHKWGEYIGTKQPQCEYIHDEPEIDSVLVYHIYEKSA